MRSGFSKWQSIITLEGVKKARKRQVMGLVIGVFYGAVVIFIFLNPSNEGWLKGRQILVTKR